MSFCPLRSNEKEIECSANCALYSENTECCAIKNLGTQLRSIDVDLENVNDTLYEITQRMRY